MSNKKADFFDMMKREIPFQALGGIFDSDDMQAVTRLLQAATEPDGDFFPLPEENDFQKALARHEGAQYAVAVNSCGTALDLCMMALAISPQDEVITTPLTFVCTAGCAVAQGARVIFADVNPATLNLDPESVRARITPRTRAIIPVHFAGLAAEIEAFEVISRDTGIPIIYDAAHAVSAKQNGRPIGGAGKASCYSFQSNKNMTTLGEGGAVLGDDPEFMENIRRNKTFGYVYGPQLRVVSVGFNYRMTKIQCAAGLSQLAKIERIVSQRQALMLRMQELLSDIEEIILPVGMGPEHGSHLYVIRVDTDRVGFTRDDFRAKLKNDYGVATVLHYPPVWSWEAFAKLGYSETEARCPIAAKASSQVVTLPIFPQTSNEDLSYINWAIRQTLNDLGNPALATGRMRDGSIAQ